jgi:hypothetical protein
MRKIISFLMLLALSLASAAVQAQIKCWTESGKRVCGDNPPPGAKVTTIKGSTSPADPAPAAKDAAKDGKAAKRGPLTPAEQEQDYRKRQAEAQKAAEKSDAERKNAEAKRENCERSKEALRNLESGQRIMRTDAKGERYFLDDAQIGQETAKARQAAQDSCS